MKTIQPRKQRRELFKGRLSRESKKISGHLSKSLREKYKKRSFTIVKGDEVKIMRGKFSGSSGAVETIDMAKGRIYIEGIQVPKADGTKAKVGLIASNLMLTKLNLKDKKRLAKIEMNLQKKVAKKWQQDTQDTQKD